MVTRVFYRRYSQHDVGNLEKDMAELNKNIVNEAPYDGQFVVNVTYCEKLLTRKHKGLSSIEAAKMVEERRKGETIGYLANKYRCSCFYIRKVLRAEGFEKDYRGVSHRRKLSAEQVCRIREGLAEGRTIVSVAEEIGIVKQIVWNIKHGKSYVKGD